ncbi:hypothetical protein [Gramella sp. KN1008]|uniref:DUF7670 domain-containing protein n=1 Tax=Gramella sp. KN1008 TaxID=2529298 RepID=UPI00103B62BC|nr:hypothetical protein [Gramella sp. KN1008]TBW28894.1 hypothetical protein EZJ28_03160 [Gramella sp. KN1008]
MITYFQYLTRSILWVARAWGSIILAFVLFFLIAHIFGTEETGTGSLSNKDIITFICFPIGTITGLALAYKWPGLGGLISSLSIITAMLLNNVLDLKFLLGIFPPGMLYLLYWYLDRKQHEHPERMKLH